VWVGPDWLPPGVPQAALQTDEQRTGLLARYAPDKLFRAERNVNAAQDLDVAVLEGDLVGVIKQQDPMGSNNRWLIDNGGKRTCTRVCACITLLQEALEMLACFWFVFNGVFGPLWMAAGQWREENLSSIQSSISLSFEFHSILSISFN